MKRGLLVLAFAVILVGCHRDMWDQPKVLPLGENQFFDDKAGSRMPVPGTVARNQVHEDAHLYEGLLNGSFATTFPYEITAEKLKWGQSRYDIFCLPCHSKSGDGLGMIVQRGFKQPPSFHTQRLIDAPVGYYFRTLKYGYGPTTYGMLPPALQPPAQDGPGVVKGQQDDKVHPVIAKRISVDDVWALIAYIRALQFSQHAPLEYLSPEDLKKVKEGAQPPKEATGEHR